MREGLKIASVVAVLTFGAGDAAPSRDVFVEDPAAISSGPCSEPFLNAEQYARNIALAAAEAERKHEYSIGEALMGCPLEAVTLAADRALGDVIYMTGETDYTSREEAIDIILRSRAEVMNRRYQVAMGYL